MRKLVILRGAQGCGKSTFIKENDLEIFTLSADQIRLMYSSPEMTINYKEEIPQFNNKKVWDLLFTLLENRMKRGEFTIIDAVHANAKETFSNYKKLAEKYRYRLYVLDFTDIPKEEVYKRNAAREEYKQVPEYAIDRAYKQFEREKTPSSFKVIKPENFNDIITNTPRDFNNYKNIHIFGDIHGCYTTLKKYFEKFPINQEDAYIFTGDYFDRGLENYQTFNYLLDLMKNDNMIFLVGNHEDKLYKYACDDDFKMDYDIKNTIEEFASNNLSKSSIRGFTKSLSQLCYMTFNNKTYLISHGGIPYFPKLSLDFYSTNSFIYGIDKYEVNIDEIYNKFMDREENKIIQIHGHRNLNKISFDEYPYSINLEGDIEHGGYLRVLTISKDKTTCQEIKNDIYNPNLVEETNVFNLIDDLRHNKFVNEKQLSDDISSFNFTKESFKLGIWDNMTTQARGLFINTKKYKVVARSYNKFFKINERKETSIEELSKTFAYPLNFYLKYNGFLGILSANNDELFFASKSTNEGDYVDYFKTIFYQQFNEKQIASIKKKITKDNLSFVFEVIDPINDPHIIEYSTSKIVLLDMIYNQTEYNKLSYDELKSFSQENNIPYKELVYEALNYDGFIKYYEEITSDDYKYNDEYIEGFVIEDINNYMVKTKTMYYDKWKRLRNRMENSLRNNSYSSKSKDPFDQQFISYLKEKYENKEIDIKKINIISERKEFEDIS